MCFSISKSNTFNLADTLLCGQIFRYKIDGQNYAVISKDKYLVAKEDAGVYNFQSNDDEYFKNFLHLDYDYPALVSRFSEDRTLTKSIQYSSGIHILKQDPFEMIVSFLISQNNNIPRIQSTIEKMCSTLGNKIVGTDFFSFPTCEVLANADLSSFSLGYRDTYVSETCKALLNINLDELKALETKDLYNYLISLKGVGPKVANCILLFGFGKYDVFPVDTWILKVFNTSNAKKLTKELETKYGKFSGFVQQWLFYFKRSAPVAQGIEQQSPEL